MSKTRVVGWFMVVAAFSALYAAFSQPLRFAVVGATLEAAGPPSPLTAVATFAIEALLMAAPWLLLALFCRWRLALPAPVWLAPLAGFCALYLTSALWTGLVGGTGNLLAYEIVGTPAAQLVTDAASVAAGCCALLRYGRRPAAHRTSASLADSRQR